MTYTSDEVPKDFMSPTQYAEWVSVKTALNVITKELIETRRSQIGGGVIFALGFQNSRFLFFAYPMVSSRTWLV